MSWQLYGFPVISLPYIRDFPTVLARILQTTTFKCAAFTFLVGGLIIKVSRSQMIHGDYCAKKMHKSTVLMVGADTEIGKQVARDILNRGGRVVMAHFDYEELMKAASFATLKSGCSEAAAHIVDLSNRQSVKKFADVLSTTERHLDRIIINADCFFMKEVTSSSNQDMHWAYNFLGPVYLLWLLRNMLKSASTAEPCRIVIVTKNHYKQATTKWLNFHDSDGVYNAYQAYCQSKLALLAFVRYVDIFWKENNFQINAVDIGLTKTDRDRGTTFEKRTAAYNIVAHLLSYVRVNPHEYAVRQIMYPLISDKWKYTSGHLLSSFQKEELPLSYWTEENVQDFWKTTCASLNIKNPD